MTYRYRIRLFRQNTMGLLPAADSASTATIISQSTTLFW